MRTIRYLCVVVLLFAITSLRIEAQPLTRGISQQTSWVPANVGIESQNVWSLLFYVDSDNNEVLVAGTDEGIFISQDLGDTWALAGLDTSSVSDLVYAAGELNAATYKDGIFVQDDNGDWKPKNSGLDNRNVGALTIDQNGVLLASVVLGGVYRFNDQAAAWELAVTSDLDNPFVPSLAIDDQNAIFAGTDNGVLRSIDDGNTWELINNGLGNLHIESLLLDKETLFAGTDFGVYRTVDGGANWEAAHGDEFSQTNVRVLAANSLNAIYAGTHDKGVFRSFDHGNTWTALNDGLSNLGIASMFITPNGVMFAGTIGSGVFRRDAVTDVSNETETQIPAEFQLIGNYPNPFAHRTNIKYGLARQATISLTLYDVMGRAIAVIDEGDKSAGWHEVTYNASHLPSGIYFYKLKADNFVTAKHFIIAR